MPSAAARGRAISVPEENKEEEEEEDDDDDDDDRRKDSVAAGSKKRAPNFSTAEDVIIAKCWRNMTNDASIGTDQKGDVFWQRLFVKYTTAMIEEGERTRAFVNEHRSWSAVRSRWRRCIQKECMLFGSIYRRVRATEKSGWNEDDYTKEAIARYRGMSGKNREFSYLGCWKVLSDEPKFKLMLKASSPNDEGVPVIICTDDIDDAPEGDSSAITSASQVQAKNKVRNSAGSFSSIHGPPLGAGGRPIGVKKAKVALREALANNSEQNDLAGERHKEVTGLLDRLGDRMLHLADRIDVQSSFLGSFVYLQMGETDNARKLADAGRNDLFRGKKKRDETVETNSADDDNDNDGDDDDADDDDFEDGSGKGKDSMAVEEAQAKNKNKSAVGDATSKFSKLVDAAIGRKTPGPKRVLEQQKDDRKYRKKKATEEAKYGYCCAGRRCGRFAITGGALDRMNFSPNAGSDLDEILLNPKHRCTGCCKAFCGGTCGIGESADDYICNDCLSLP